MSGTRSLRLNEAYHVSSETSLSSTALRPPTECLSVGNKWSSGHTDGLCPVNCTTRHMTVAIPH